VYADRAFLTFLAGLHRGFDRLVVIGRLSPEPGRSAYPLPAGVTVAGLPHFPDLLRPLAFTGALVRGARRVRRVIGDADAAFVLGPSPMSVLIAVIALVRRRRVVLRVRQNPTQYVRSRHPGRRLVHVGADLLEPIWKSMSRRCPVGTEVGSRDAGAQSRRGLHVSLVHERDLAGPAVAAARSYDGDIRVLRVGRLESEKNPLMLADVLAELRCYGGRHWLVVCGKGPYRTSHVLLHVSWREGLPQMLYKAFASRLPVVATDVGGVRAASGGAALLIRPGDPAAAAEAVARVTGDAALRDVLIEAGAARAAQHTHEAEQRRLAAFIAGAPGGSASG
jgi:glycosyltransferase involved in cell wall biosynthesis